MISLLDLGIFKCVRPIPIGCCYCKRPAHIFLSFFLSFFLCFNYSFFLILGSLTLSFFSTHSHFFFLYYSILSIALAHTHFRSSSLSLFSTLWHAAVCELSIGEKDWKGIPTLSLTLSLSLTQTHSLSPTFISISLFYPTSNSISLTIISLPPSLPPSFSPYLFYFCHTIFLF